ncbi:uncharacterized protein ASCRUDRAFT_8265 [Ascoidea rubescens DSM 1968]|uniref:Uncharacterized protein n=1 Tax=Ascoidea rubescens DSM 1968 TaxID=1344418 RepID=A0A1D2VG74_9ASCO|nr:hypothetical protein ASCRUDRAFT_8265 [Ascoidea rubescens DSM 1968]ODV60646.1 hypothetical protein ASCRUDRAFT_8265 [Ascoidea rubescens DSM 1968]
MSIWFLTSSSCNSAIGVLIIVLNSVIHKAYFNYLNVGMIYAKISIPLFTLNQISTRYSARYNNLTGKGKAMTVKEVRREPVVVDDDCLRATLADDDSRYIAFSLIDAASISDGKLNYYIKLTEQLYHEAVDTAISDKKIASKQSNHCCQTERISQQMPVGYECHQNAESALSTYDSDEGANGFSAADSDRAKLPEEYPAWEDHLFFFEEGDMVVDIDNEQLLVSDNDEYLLKDRTYFNRLIDSNNILRFVRTR